MFLEIRELSVSYGAIAALHKVSFNVPRGGIVAIIGANGAGKSTILNTISGLLKPTSGKIIFNGTDITGLPPHYIVKKGIVQAPEGRGIFATLTVMENLELAAESGRAQTWKHDYDHVFEIFPRLKERRKQSSGTLSGGEQQMLAVARALLAKGDVLLLDEPSMGLAPALVENIFNIILRICKEGTTVLLVEQNAYKAMSIAHTAYVLENGRIVLSGKAGELRDNPRIKEAYLGG
jgi:branched-chain amino acid transport system ATP-binding protein